MILEGVFEDEIGEDFVAEKIELGGQYELIERHGDGLGLAFRGLYEFSLLGGPDEILFAIRNWKRTRYSVMAPR